MDQQLLANNPIVKKLGRYLFLAVLVEIGIFVLVCYLTSFSIAVWVTLGFTLLGYSIKPFETPAEKKQHASLMSTNPLATFKMTRKVCGTLFMIPGFLTDVIALLLLLPPVRKGAVALGKKIAAKKMQKLGMGGFDPSMIASMMENMKKAGMGGMGDMGANGFGGFNPGAAAGAGSSAGDSDASSKANVRSSRKPKRERHKQTQTVDVDYEVRDGDGVWIGGHSEQPTDLAVSMKHAHSPEKVDDDVIDVEGDWK